MLRHLILLLFLVGLSLPSVAVPVQAETVAADCHGAAPALPPHHQDERDGGKTAGHMCIGCVANAPAATVTAPVALPPLVPPVQPMAALAGADVPPSIPPPRL
ncbi:MAG: hypothetical protein CVT78_03305 [Alphaproteobacteria bacterium HGW-Alphaproteobacteria-17]|nr:MAG: hypothetical protein CVT78_03305 [Alphaproteobacteria bacterium HGW-Alphaproteobacteria-17]